MNSSAINVLAVPLIGVRKMVAAVFMLAVFVCAHAQEPWQASIVASCGQSPQSINRIVVLGDTLIAATTACGPLQSVDGGLSWGPHPAGPLRDTATLEPQPMYSVIVWNGNLWASFGDEGVFLLRDGTWLHVPGIPPAVIVRVLEHDTATGILYAGSQAYGLYAFDESIQEFVRLRDVDLFESTTVNVFANTRRGFMMGTAKNGLVRIGGTNKPYQTDNRGFPFDPISTHAIVESADGWQVANTLPFSVAGGMYVRGPGSEVWKLFNDGIDKYLAFAFDVVASGRTFVLSTGYKSALGVFTWAAPQLEWLPWNDGLTDLEVSSLAVVTTSGGHHRIVAGTRSGRMFVRPEPTTSTSVSSATPPPSSKGHCVTMADIRAMGIDTMWFDLQGRRIEAPALRAGVAVMVAGGSRSLVFVTE